MNKQKSLNQYINETELKALIIKLNNSSFKVSLMNYFIEIDKLLKNDDYNSNCIIINTLNRIIEENKYQLLLIPDDEFKVLKDNIQESIKLSTEIENYLFTHSDSPDIYDDFNKNFSKILEVLNPLNIEIQGKIKNLKTKRKTDQLRFTKYILSHTNSKSQKHKRALRNRIIQIAERNEITKDEYERFGELVLLIIKNILKKPKFSGYSYRDDFYSDSTDKIFRYIKNFNHKLISKITGYEVNAFSYVSQYVHNSILYIINTKNAETQSVQNYINDYAADNKEQTEEINESSYYFDGKTIIKNIYIESDNKLLDSISREMEEIPLNSEINDLKIHYSKDYKIGIEEYNQITKYFSTLKELRNIKTISLVRLIENEEE